MVTYGNCLSPVVYDISLYIIKIEIKVEINLFLKIISSKLFLNSKHFVFTNYEKNRLVMKILKETIVNGYKFDIILFNMELGFL